MDSESGAKPFLAGWGAVVAIIAGALTSALVFPMVNAPLEALYSANPSVLVPTAALLVLLQLGLIATSLVKDERRRRELLDLRLGIGDWDTVRRAYLDFLMMIAVIGISHFGSAENTIRPVYVRQLETWGFWAFGALLFVGAIKWWRDRRVAAGAPS